MSGRKSRSGQKRAAEAVDASAVVGAGDDESAVAGSANKRTRRNSGAAVSLAEPGVDPLNSKTHEEKKRQFFSQFHTELIRAWLLDYPGWREKAPSVRTADRDALLTALVLYAARPPGKARAAQLAEMQKCWKKHNKKGGDPPGLHEVPSGKDFPPLPPSPSPKPGGAPPAPSSAEKGRITVVSSDSESEDEEMGDEDEEDNSPPPSTPPPRKKQTEIDLARSGSSTGGEANMPADGCSTCVAMPPAAAVNSRKQWLCTCGRRGDLPTEHAINRELMRVAMAKGLESRASSASAAASSTSASEPGGDKLSKLENHFSQISKQLGEDHPLFAKSLPALTPEQAFKTVRLALGNTKVQRPSQHLLALIQSGKLLNVAFALPRPLAAIDGKGELVSGLTIDLNTGKHSATTASDPTKPAQLASAAELCMALLSTILPALIDRPAAMMEWITLGRSALHLSTTEGWPIASKYVDALLVERISTHEKIALAKPSDEVLRDIRAEANTSRLFPQNEQSRPPAQQKPQGVCHNYNRSGCNRGASCRFEHICANPTCGKRHPASSVEGCRASIPQPQSSSTVIIPGGSSRKKSSGAVRSGGSVVTVKSAPAPSEE